MSKIINYSEFEKILTSVLQDFDDTVLSTFGPKGQVVLLDYGDNGGMPHVTKDGVTVADLIVYEDTAKNMIASVIKEGARNINDQVGDGTTTATLLIVGLFEELLNGNVELSPTLIKDIEEGIAIITEYLMDITIPVTLSSKEIETIIKISSNNDPEIVKHVMDTIQKVGENGIIEVEASDSQTPISVNITNGAFVNSPIKVEARDYGQPFNIVLVEGPLNNTKVFSDIVNQHLMIGNKNLLFIAKEFSDSVMESTLVNNSKKKTNIVLMEAEGFAASRLDIMKHLNHVLDNMIYYSNENTKNSIDKFSINESTAKTYHINKYNSGIVIEHNTDLEAPEIKQIIKDLQSELDELIASRDPLSNGKISILKMQLHKYVSLATIKVGGITAAEMKERKDRMDDAVHAVSASVEGGVLPGGGTALLLASKILKQDHMKNNSAVEILENMCQYPLLLLLGSINYDSATKIEEVIEKVKKEELVFDITTETYSSITNSEIYDPAFALIKSLQNAVAVTKVLANTSSIIIRE